MWISGKNMRPREAVLRRPHQQTHEARAHNGWK
jgi:hypothetical protein